MTTSVRPLKEWSDRLQKWFIEQLSNKSLQGTERTGLERLASDERMQIVAIRLAKEINRLKDDSLRGYDVAFIEMVWQTPRDWQSLRKNYGSRWLKDRAKVKRACDQAIDQIQKHQKMAFSAIDLEFGQEKRDPGEIFKTVVDALTAIGDYAEGAFLADAPMEYFYLPRKLGYGKAEQVFAIKAISDFAKLLFQKPLYEETGIIVTVLYGLTKDVSLTRVKEIYKQFRKPRRGLSDFEREWMPDMEQWLKNQRM